MCVKVSLVIIISNMKNFFFFIKFIFLSILILISVTVISLWNIQSNLPDTNISDYFPNEITKIYDTNYDLLYHVGTKDRFYLEYEQIPKEMIEAIISAEDKNYFSHITPTDFKIFLV